jgi:glyoxylase-like metal-dependent hydrolase (beta-lactamase superfamily II)/rhodanese-related sulfurtransferase
MKQSFLQASQLYELWKSEPESVQVLDIRQESKFEACHIPGSQFSTVAEVFDSPLLTDENRLVVLVTEDGILPTGSESKSLSTVVLLESGFGSWVKKGFPTAPPSNFIQLIQTTEAVMQNEPLFYQLFEAESSTYTYLLADPATKEAILIDPVLETVERDMKLIQELGVRLIYVLDTHVHADHITGAGEIRKHTGAKTAVGKGAKVDCVDIALEDGQEIQFGSFVLKAIATPGHTDSCMSFLVGNKVFTGDALLIRSNGRTDFQQGSPHKLFNSVTNRLYKLPDDTFIFPAHDYRGHTHSTIGLEKRFNARIPEGRPETEFTKIMQELKLANPKKIHEAVPANMACGRKIEARTFSPQIVSGVPEITVEILRATQQKTTLIDVRKPEEFTGELGHIAGAKLVTLGADLNAFLETQSRAEEFVFICRTGNRSREACELSQKLGYKFTVNLQGGMTRWNELKFPVEK